MKDQLGYIARMLKVGVVGFGGGSALIPIMGRELVAPSRLSAEEFAQDTVIANITPGALPVKLAALSGVRLGGGTLALAGAMAVALPGTAGTVALLAIFAALGDGAVRIIEFASLGITAFIVYLMAHYVVKVLAPRGRLRIGPAVIAAVAFLTSGAGKTTELAGALSGHTPSWRPPELSALGLVLAALVVIAGVTLFQYARRASPVATPPSRSPSLRAAIIAAIVFASLAAAGVLVGLWGLPLGEAAEFLLLLLFSTVTSFGGGEAYVGVADGFFVASGAVAAETFYGQIVPVANALPGPILVKVAAGVAYSVSPDMGWLLAAAALLIAVGACSAIAIAVLAGYSKAKDSLIIRNITDFIMPVICGLLASTTVSMVHSNVRIAEGAGVSPWIALVVTVAAAVSVPLIHRFARLPDIMLIVALGAASTAWLTWG